MIKAHWTKSDWAKLLGIACFIFIFFFNSSRAFRFGYLNWQTDEGCYLQHLGDYIGIQGDHLCQSFTAEAKNDHAWGTSIFWVLPGLIGKGIAHLRHEDVTGWVLGFAGMSSYAAWILALYFIVRILRLKRVEIGAGSAWVPLFALFILFNTYTLHYGTADVFMAHAVEILLSFACVFFLLKNEFLLALFFATFLTLTRYNDAPVVLLLVGHWIDKNRESLSVSRLKVEHKALLGVGAATLIGFGFWFAFYRGYYGATLPDLLGDVQWENFRNFLYSTHWGVLWSGFWWLAALLIGIVRFHKQSNLARAATIWVFLEAFLVVLWNGNGTDFGNRYLSGSYSAALLIWLEAISAAPTNRWKNRTFEGLVWSNGFWVALMTIIYAKRPSLTPRWEQGFCYIPTNITLETAKNIFNPDVYVAAFYKQLMPVQLYFSHYASKLPPNTEFVAIHGPEYKVLFAMTVLCAAYLLVYAGTRSTSLFHVKQHGEEQELKA